MKEERKCCKWCDQCSNTDIEKSEGYCNLDIGEYIEDTISQSCNFYKFNGNLSRS